MADERNFTDFIIIIHTKHKGKGELLPLNGGKREFFDFASSRINYNGTTKPKFPVHLFFAQYANSEGSPSEEVAKNSLEMDGWNRFHIPQHAFMKLFQEHGIAPFFLFKVFCVGLWMPDKYWYYSLFTLVMLVIFECTVVQQRIGSLAEFKTMSIQPFKMQVKRASK